MKSIYIAVLNQGWIRPELANMLIHMTHDPRYRVSITYPNAQPFVNNINQIIRAFLASDCKYLLFNDNDTVPRCNSLDMADLDKDIIGAVCPQWHDGDIYWVVLDRVGDDYKPIPPNRRYGIQEVDAIGSACTMYHRRVIESVGFFAEEWTDGIMTKGSDLAYCDRAKEAGFKVWANWNCPCSHFKTIDLMNVLELVTND